MLGSLRRLRLDRQPADVRNEILETLQGVLVEKVRAWHNRRRIAFTFDPSQSTWRIVREILEQARETKKEGPVAQYLVGAKLQLRYPGEQVENFSFSTSDVQQGRPGDFLLGDTAFHVTVSPTPGLYERCRENLRNDLRVYLVVPDRILVGAHQNAESIEPGRIFVESIEGFVGGNVDELSAFARSRFLAQFRLLLETYNRRVDAVETDKSMLIEIPRALSGRT
jgi:hypothetical protein